MFLKVIRRPLGTVLPLDEVTRRAICDALDKCGGNYLLAAHLLGIGKTTVYRKARAYHYQHPKVQGKALMSISRSRDSEGQTRSAHGYGHEWVIGAAGYEGTRNSR
jgi:hypothetical protein